MCYNGASILKISRPNFSEVKTMKVAVIGSRGLTVPDLDKYLPPDTTEIVSGGAKGVDTSA